MRDEFLTRLIDIVSDIDLGMECKVVLDRDRAIENGRYFVQIKCWRKDVITKKWDWGYGGKAYLSPAQTTNEIVQAIFGLFLAYWTHEARENFEWRGRRVYGPHIAVEALWEAAPHVDVRSAQHVDDRPGPVENDGVPLAHMDA
jgi:hypothetical protein